MLYLIADTHFGHGRVIEYESRPFTDYKEMDDKLLSNWNETVKNDDTIIHLGDVFVTHAERRDMILSRLKGNKFLLRGNHDKKSPNLWDRHGFSVIEGDRFQYDISLPIIYTHYPLEYLEGGKELLEQGYFNVHGHVHTNIGNLDQSNHLCISVELTKYSPISYEAILDEVSARRGGLKL